jgi:MFS family permease
MAEERETRTAAPEPQHEEQTVAEREERTVTERDDRRREEYGGFDIGAVFFGWLVATGLAVLLTAILSATGAAIGLTEISGEGQLTVTESNDAVSLVGGIVLVLILLLAYLAGGYVAGRMSRFDGGRQGVGVWVLGLAVTILLAVAGAIAGSEYNVLQDLDQPRIPVDEGDLETGALIALAVIVVGTLVAAVAGGKAGQRYHRKVDRAGYMEP